ncbi:MAG: polynucleotide adenylyltransferase PcnB [Kiritimatiellae bacterium]|nr:polynucleotide adenylyltransferase PcnB [Kiritimatiellia bacterium]
MLFFKRDTLVVRPRAEHNISRRDIDPDALKVLYRLADAGYKAYLVGGGVRDLLMGRKPKDFDVSTDAHPREIKRLFRNCFLVGRRFRLAHVVFGQKVVEASTFRRQPPAEEADEDVPGGLYQSSDNTFGTPEEDAKRRDFTVNGLFYDIKTFSVIDYVGGLRDLDRRVLRCIGDPNVRFREDPVRMLRAVRLSARLELRMDGAVRRAIKRHYSEIASASVPRVLEEVFRLFGFASAAPTFRQLWETRMLEALLPEVHSYVSSSGRDTSVLWSYLKALDDEARKQDGDLHNGLRLAVLYWPIFCDKLAAARQRGESHANHLHLAEETLQPFNQRLHPPKAVFYHAAHLLDSQQRLDRSPALSRRQRPMPAEGFKDAMLLARIRQSVAATPNPALREWEQQPHAEGDQHHAHCHGGRREPSHGPTPPVDEANLETPVAQAPTDRGANDRQCAAVADTDGRPSRRRRHRGGRRHKRHLQAMTPDGNAAAADTRAQDA